MMETLKVFKNILINLNKKNLILDPIQKNHWTVIFRKVKKSIEIIMQNLKNLFKMRKKDKRF
jgi:hypothetical protein